MGGGIVTATDERPPGTYWRQSTRCVERWSNGRLVWRVTETDILMWRMSGACIEPRFVGSDYMLREFIMHAASACYALRVENGDKA